MNNVNAEFFILLCGASVFPCGCWLLILFKMFLNYEVDKNSGTLYKLKFRFGSASVR